MIFLGVHQRDVLWLRDELPLARLAPLGPEDPSLDRSLDRGPTGVAGVGRDRF